MKKFLLFLLLITGAFLLRTCFYTVDASEFVYVTRLGEHIATYDGGNPEEAGLHFGWPWPIESVVRIDRRLQHFELPAVELMTEDQRMGGTIDMTLTIDGFVCWRVPDKEAVDRFVRSVGSVDQARALLLDRIRGDLGAAIPAMSREDLINENAQVVDAKREELRQKLLAPHQRNDASEERSSLDDGIAVVDIRIRRINHPAEVRPDVSARIVSERRKKAASYLSEGRRQAEVIRSESDAKISKLKASVLAELQEKKGAAQAQADRIRNAAQSKDPDYYAELKRRQIAMNGFKDKTKIWSTRLWELLFPFPSEKKTGKMEGGK